MKKRVSQLSEKSSLLSGAIGYVLGWLPRSRPLYHRRSHLSRPPRRRSSPVRVGDGPYRSRARQRFWLCRSVHRSLRPYSLVSTALSSADRGCLQDLRRLHARSAWVLLTINSIFSAATSSVVYEIAARLFPAHRARQKDRSLVGMALGSLSRRHAVRGPLVLDLCVTAFLFSKILVIALRVRGVGEESPADGPAPETQTTARWAAFGILSGLVGLLNSTLLLFLPVLRLVDVCAEHSRPKLQSCRLFFAAC